MSHFPATVVEKLLYNHSGVMKCYFTTSSGGKVTLKPQWWKSLFYRQKFLLNIRGREAWNKAACSKVFPNCGQKAIKISDLTFCWTKLHPLKGHCKKIPICEIHFSDHERTNISAELEKLLFYSTHWGNRYTSRQVNWRKSPTMRHA
jgi:hypothetical protein